MSDPVEIDTGDGLLCFDGRVLERFGYGRGSGMMIPVVLDEEQVPELEGFLDKVRAAVPNLEQDR